MNLQKNIDKNFTFSTSVWLIPFAFVFILWLVYYYTVNYNQSIYYYGVLPKSSVGLKGIPLHIFIHGNVSHLWHNTIPAFILLMALRFFYRKQFWLVFISIVLGSGFGTWCIGSNNYHVGASGLIYGLVSFMFFKGILTKYYRLVALSFVLVLLYGGLVFYMFPSNVTNVAKISWEGHLSGFITGLLLAVSVKTPQFNKPIFYDWEHPNFNPKLDPFIKNFDESGNFINPPKPEEVESYFQTSVRVIYEFLAKK
jgi:membrane associated rhomboid family serine protease